MRGILEEDGFTRRHGGVPSATDMETKVTVSLDAELLREIEQIAADEGRSVSALVSGRLESLVRERKGHSSGLRSPVLRTAELRVRLPRHQIAMLEYRAEQQATTVSGVLERELDRIASAHAEELSETLPEFAAAVEWPDEEQERIAC